VIIGFIVAANTTITEDLRRKLEALAGPDRTADDLANEAVASYISHQEKDRDWRDLVSFGQKSGAAIRLH
jgi:hypothetical protein